MGSFYEFMLGSGKPAEKKTEDEAIGQWTHKFVVYCKDPQKDFENKLKSMDSVVAVFGKAKESKSEEDKPTVQA